MKPGCRDLEVLRSIYSSGALEGEEAARVAAHLEACADCREADRRDRELLGLVKLPEPTPAETQALAEVPARTLRELKRRERRFTWVRRLGAGTGIAAIAAGAILMLLTPRWPQVTPPTAGSAGSAVASIDDGSTDFFYDDNELDADDDSSSSPATSTSTSPTEIALAAYDAGVGN
jgi:hypothetical protein